jgi:uncharacterized cupin superfamily protein
MKYLALILLLTGCQADLKMTVTDADGSIKCEVTAKTARQITMAMQDCETATIISGKVAISDETVQALGRKIP